MFINLINLCIFSHLEKIKKSSLSMVDNLSSKQPSKPICSFFVGVYYLCLRYIHGLKIDKPDFSKVKTLLAIFEILKIYLNSVSKLWCPTILSG